MNLFCQVRSFYNFQEKVPLIIIVGILRPYRSSQSFFLIAFLAVIHHDRDSLYIQKNLAEIESEILSETLNEILSKTLNETLTQNEISSESGLVHSNQLGLQLQNDQLLFCSNLMCISVEIYPVN